MDEKKPINFSGRNMLKPGKNYEEIRQAFRWEVPEQYNLGIDVCDKHPANKRALIYEDEAGNVTTYTFGQLSKFSNRCRLTRTINAQNKYCIWLMIRDI